MCKNIILCSDGTGNKGGYGADTNVFKLYNAVDIHNAKTQITYYDDGVGTNTNKYIRGVTGAFGLGFGKNIRELYAFLARNYDPGEEGDPRDEIYLFGFSRGAATVRAFAGMVQECGLLDVNGDFCETNNEFDESKFQYQVKKAFKAYRWRNLRPQEAENFKNSKGVIVNAEGLDSERDVPIKFIGVWDTVPALGVPQDWSLTVNWFFWTLDKILDLIFPHTFYNYQLNENIENVHHAIAIDDERKTFRPKVWREKAPERTMLYKCMNFFMPKRDFTCPQNIEQVWFAGVHSNVGGGYPRVGLSVVTLDWMVEKAKDHDLEFKDGVYKEVAADANVYGKLYDSRDGRPFTTAIPPETLKSFAMAGSMGLLKSTRRFLTG